MLRILSQCRNIVLKQHFTLPCIYCSVIPTKTLLSLFGLKFLSRFIWDERDVVMSSSWRNTCHALIGRKKLKMSVKVSFSQRFLISQLLILQKSYLKTFLWFIAAVLDNDDLLKFSLNRNRSHNPEVWKKIQNKLLKIILSQVFRMRSAREKQLFLYFLKELKFVTELNFLEVIPNV